MNRNPKIKISELRQDDACFELTITDIITANFLHRILIATLPTLAVELVEFELTRRHLKVTKSLIALVYSCARDCTYE